MYKIIGANNAEYGPVTAEQLRLWISEGRVNAETLAQAEGETDWKPIASYAEFAASFPSASPGSAPPTTAKSPPTFSAGAASLGSRETALSEVNGPAIGLIVVGALIIVAGGFGAVSNLLRSAGITNGFNNQMLFRGQDPQVAHFARMFGGPVGVVLAVVQMALGAFVIYGGVKMKALQSYGICIAASIISLIPCTCCCCVAIPIGIWAIVVLNKPEVRPHFS